MDISSCLMGFYFHSPLRSGDCIVCFEGKSSSWEELIKYCIVSDQVLSSDKCMVCTSKTLAICHIGQFALGPALVRVIAIL